MVGGGGAAVCAGGGAVVGVGSLPGLFGGFLGFMIGLWLVYLGFCFSEVVCFQSLLGYSRLYGLLGARLIGISRGFGGQEGDNPVGKLFVFSVSWVISTISRGAGTAEGGECQKGLFCWVQNKPSLFHYSSLSRSGRGGRIVSC